MHDELQSWWYSWEMISRTWLSRRIWKIVEKMLRFSFRINLDKSNLFIIQFKSDFWHKLIDKIFGNTTIKISQSDKEVKQNDVCLLQISPFLECVKTVFTS